MINRILKTASPYNLIEVKCNEAHPNAYKPHLHSELAVGIIQSGETVVAINGANYHLKVGDAIVIMPYVIHNCQPVDIDNWAYTMVFLRGEYQAQIMAQLEASMQIGIVKLDEAIFQQIESLAESLKTESDSFIREVVLVDCINEIVDCLQRRVIRAEDAQMMAIRDYLEIHFLESMSLDDMAAQFNINKFSLIKRFKQLFDITPAAYQLQLKVNYAKQLMRESQDLADVACRSGFFDQAHLTREFKKSSGLTPGQYTGMV
jgi:AraC-like DNA-binding protein